MKSAYNQSSSYQSNIMRKYLFIICTFISVFNLCAQSGLPIRPYEKIKFNSLEYIWHEVAVNKSIESDTLDGYNHLSKIAGLQPLLIDNKVITAYHQKGPNHSFYGCYLECRDINTGVKLWSHDFGNFKGQHQEITRIMYIEDGKLVTINQLNKNSFDKNYNNFYYPDMILSKRIYNIQNGNIISYNHKSFDDYLAYETNYDLFYDNYKFYKEDENIRYIYQDKINGKEFISSVLLDSTGAFISKDTLSFKYVKYYFNFEQIHKDTFVCVQFTNDGTSLIFQYLSPNLKEYKSIVSPYVFDEFQGYILLDKISGDKSKLLFYNKRNGFFPDSYMEIYVFELKSGIMLKKASLKDTYFERFEAINWDNQTDSLIILQGLVKDDNQSNVLYSALEVIKVGNIDSVLLIKEYLPSDTLRVAIPYDFIKVNDDKYIIYFIERGLLTNSITNNISAFDDNARAQGMMLINKQDLGLLPSAVHDGDFSDATILLPNPVTESLNIRFATPYKGLISISDISGRTVMVRDVTDLSEEVNIDMSYLASGIYIVRLPKHVSAKSYKVVKM